MSRIKTIGGGGGGATPTVVIGPEFGTDIMQQEHDFGTSFRAEANYKVTHEQVIRLFEVICGPHLVSVEHDISGTYIGPPQFQGVESSTQSGTTSITVSVPSTTPGNYQLALIGHLSTGGNFVAPTGWTTLAQVVEVELSGCALGALHKFSSAGDSTAYTFTWSGGANPSIGTILSFSDVDPVSPVNAVGESTGNATDPVAPSITATTGNVFLVAACAQNNANTQTYTPPAGYAERSDLAGNGVAVCTGEVATRIQGSSGATGTATLNSNQAIGSNYAALHIAINAKSGGSTFS